MDERLRVRAMLTKPIPRPAPAVRLIIALVLGLATTVAIAWSLAYWGGAAAPGWALDGFMKEPATLSVRAPSHAPDGGYQVQAARFYRWGTEVVEVGLVWADGRPPYGSPHDTVERTSFASEMKDKFDQGEAPTAWWRADGWPLPALSAGAHWRSYDSKRIQRVVGGLLLGTKEIAASNPVRMFPLQPVWTGFVIDTLLYASIWFAIFSLRDIRSAMRRRRGRCARCGYMLVPEQTRCSECGAEVK